MNGNYIIPSNSKKQGLIFGFMRLPDLILVSIAILISFVLFMSFPITNIVIAILALLPFLIGVFLVFPIPNYHNCRYLLVTIFRFYFKDIRRYYWRGWCYQYEQPTESDELPRSGFPRNF